MRVLYPLGEFEAKAPRGSTRPPRTCPGRSTSPPTPPSRSRRRSKDSEHTHSGFVALKVKDAIVDRLREEAGRPARRGQPRTPPCGWWRTSPDSSCPSRSTCAASPCSAAATGPCPPSAPLKETLAAAVLRRRRLLGRGAAVRSDVRLGHLAHRGGAHRRAHARPAWAATSASRPGRTWARRRASDARGLARRRQGRKAARCPSPSSGSTATRRRWRRRRRTLRRPGSPRPCASRWRDATRRAAARGSRRLLVTNPPYGDRLEAGGQKGMKTFYFKLGEAFARHQGWRMAVLSGNPAFESAFHAGPNRRRSCGTAPSSASSCSTASARASLVALEDAADVPAVGEEHQQEQHDRQHRVLRGRRPMKKDDPTATMPPRSEPMELTRERAKTVA